MERITIRGLLINPYQLKSDDNQTLLLSFPKDFNVNYYVHRYIFIMGYFCGESLIVEEVVLA